ncbi:MAG: glycoside hydrolase family 3 C-terminal domain-containing protein, partial [Treponema sp.]|nr:glycoside hydrolase family 3 C-terminal domain-containing protein [Treponema sp.]
MSNYIYQDASRPITERVRDLMGRLSLNQKIRQLSGIMVTGAAADQQIVDGIGGVTFMPVSGGAGDMAAQIRELQQRIMAATPFGIPAIFHAEALSGLVAPGCAIFPTSISLGAAFAPDLVRDMADRIRRQMLNLGIRQALSPVLDLARDFRWGRTNEDYSSDPTMTAILACAFIEGLQGEDLSEGVAATGKHFLGYSLSEGGLNLARSATDSRDIRENSAKPFEAAIRLAKLRSVMNAYSEYNGLPICASQEILTELLRDDLGFQGLVVSDYMSLDMLVKTTRTAEDSTEAAIQALKAGLDMELPKPYGYGPGLREAVNKGRIDEAYIDRALERVLSLKFELGLFEKPFRDFVDMDNAEHDKQSALVSEKLITLTKNSGILPLKDRNTSIVVIGPAGNSIRAFNGSYTYPAGIEMMMGMMAANQGPAMQGVEINLDTMVDAFQDTTAPVQDLSPMVEGLIRQGRGDIRTIYEALEEIFPGASYVKGCSFNEDETSGFADALEAAAKADVVVMAVGGKNGWGTTCTNGEGIDNSDISLPGRQAELVQRVFAVNKNMILVHTDNKPLVAPFVYEQIPAIIEGWLPGLYGGNAIAKVIAGIVNPGGKLPVDVPRAVGQQPVYFYQHRGSRSDAGMSGISTDGYRDITCRSQLPFGYGLSYTSFAYSDGTLSTKTGDDGVPLICVSVTVKNSGA